MSWVELNRHVANLLEPVETFNYFAEDLAHRHFLARLIGVKFPLFLNAFLFLVCDHLNDIGGLESLGSAGELKFFFNIVG